MKKKVMKKAPFYFFTVFIFSSFSIAFAQDARKFGATKFTNFLAGTSWKTQGVPFETKDQQTCSLHNIDTSSFDRHWGHFIDFDSLTFSSHYSAPCGNDCFTSVRGLYWFSAENKVRVKITAIDRHGFCEKKSEVLNKDYGYYDVVKTVYGYDLKSTQIEP